MTGFLSLFDVLALTLKTLHDFAQQLSAAALCLRWHLLIHLIHFFTLR